MERIDKETINILLCLKNTCTRNFSIIWKITTEKSVSFLNLVPFILTFIYLTIGVWGQKNEKKMLVAIHFAAATKKR